MLLLFDIAQWWAGISSTVMKIYWLIAFPSTLIFVIQTILTVAGGDMDGDSDFDADHDVDVDPGFHIFTVKNIVAFFTIFSWAGIAMSYAGFNIYLTGIIALAAGIAMMFIMAALFYGLSKLSESGTLKMENALGKTGTVYLTIAANKARKGKVQIKIQNSLRTLDAVTEDAEDIKTGSAVEVLDVESQNVLVVKRKR